MGILQIITYILSIILVVILIILSIRCIKMIDKANNFIIDMKMSLESINYFFEIIDQVSLFIKRIPKYIDDIINNIFGISIRKD